MPMTTDRRSEPSRRTRRVPVEGRLRAEIADARQTGDLDTAAAASAHLQRLRSRRIIGQTDYFVEDDQR
jgi:hypothetical protein